MNATKLKKKTTCFQKSLLLNFEKIDGLKLFEFVEQFVMDILKTKLTQFEKTGSISKTFFAVKFELFSET